jgi:type II secretory pathway pseudopilin PulG
VKSISKKIFGTNNHGFTLIELIISMGLFMGVIIIASQAFLTIINQSVKLTKMEETNIEGVLGLEVMRHDLMQMGFGLPWGWVTRNSAENTLVDSGFTYKEATDTFGKDLNDAPNAVPRAFVGYSPKGIFPAAYFSVKATSAARTKASQRWTYIPFRNLSSASRVFTSNNPEVGDKVMLINSNPNDPIISDTLGSDRKLIVEPGSVSGTGAVSSFAIGYRTDKNINTNYLPTSISSTYLVYGLGKSTLDPRMPFNRADFFIGNANVPSFCAPQTGVLYKADVNHGSSTGGDYDYIPLLDCVADMQIVLGWDTSIPPSGAVNAYSSLSASAAGAVSATDGAEFLVQNWLTSAKNLREHLKVVKVYILAQEGKYDKNYTFPQTSIQVGDQEFNRGLTPKKMYTLNADQRHYRWKVYRIVVRPMNLYSNSY